MRGRKWTVRGAAGALVLLGASATGFGQGFADKPVATVNGEVITQAKLQTLLQQQGPTPVALPEGLRKQQMQIALDALINEALLRQFLKKSAPPIDDKELTGRMADLVTGLKMQNKTLEDFCREINQTPDEVKETLAARLQWYNYAKEKINDQQVEQYYRDNKDLFDQVQVHAAEVRLYVPPQGGEGEREKARQQLAQLRQKILNKEIDFAQAARQGSPSRSGDPGGDLDWIGHVKGLLPESVMKVIFDPNMVGQVSDVILSEEGCHLVKVMERKPGQPSDFAKIKEDVRRMCAEEMQQSVLKELRQSARIEVSLP